MLGGLDGKNPILAVEFAEQLRERGQPLVEATVDTLLQLTKNPLR